MDIKAKNTLFRNWRYNRLQSKKNF